MQYIYIQNTYIHTYRIHKINRKYRIQGTHYRWLQIQYLKIQNAEYILHCIVQYVELQCALCITVQVQLSSNIIAIHVISLQYTSAPLSLPHFIAVHFCMSKMHWLQYTSVCDAFLYNTVYNAFLLSTMHHGAIQCNTMHHSAMQCIRVQYSAIQCNIMHQSAIQCHTMHQRAMLEESRVSRDHAAHSSTPQTITIYHNSNEIMMIPIFYKC